MHNKEKSSCSGNQGRAPGSYLSSCTLLICLCSPAAVSASAAHQARSLQRRSLSSSSCDDFGALLQVFRISMFTTNSKTTLNQGLWLVLLSSSTCSCHLCPVYEWMSEIFIVPPQGNRPILAYETGYKNYAIVVKKKIVRKMGTAVLVYKR